MNHASEIPLPPAVRNPNKMATLRPGQGAEGRKKCTRSFASKLRRYLESGTKQALDEQGRTRLRQIFDNLVEIAIDPEHPQAVHASQVLLDRAYGRPAPSEEESRTTHMGGYRFVYVNQPTFNIPEESAVQVVEQPKPEFIGVDFEIDANFLR